MLAVAAAGVVVVLVGRVGVTLPLVVVHSHPCSCMLGLAVLLLPSIVAVVVVVAVVVDVDVVVVVVTVVVVVVMVAVVEVVAVVVVSAVKQVNSGGWREKEKNSPTDLALAPWLNRRVSVDNQTGISRARHCTPSTLVTEEEERERTRSVVPQVHASLHTPCMLFLCQSDT